MRVNTSVLSCGAGTKLISETFGLKTCRTNLEHIRYIIRFTGTL